MKIGMFIPAVSMVLFATLGTANAAEESFGSLTGDIRYPGLGDVGATIDGTFIPTAPSNVLTISVSPTYAGGGDWGMTAFFFTMNDDSTFMISDVSPNWTVNTDQKCNGCGSGNQTFSFELADEANPDWVGSGESLTFILTKKTNGNFVVEDFVNATNIDLEGGTGNPSQIAAKFQGLVDGGSAIASGYWDPDGDIFCAGDCNVVPVPAAVWFFGSGLVGLFGVSRRQRNCQTQRA